MITNQDQISKFLLEELQEGQMTFILQNIELNRMEFKIPEPELAQAILSHEAIIWTMVYESRPGCAAYSRYLELKYFHPDKTKRNNDFWFAYMKKEELLFVLIGIPKRWTDEEGKIHDGMLCIEEAMKFTGLRFSRGNMILMLGGSPTKPNTTIEGVPVHAAKINIGENAHLIENDPDSQFGKLVYDSNVSRKFVSDEEAKIIAEIERLYL